ncbi:MAG TPA: amidohydrolase, partial [Thermoanaerobaculia bacterium]|nr:amidohydrolase [Thermoanaerobaculia bacterium]
MPPIDLETYTAFHRAPELPMREEKTSAVVASRLRAIGYDVTERVGRYADPNATCYGVVAVMRNGSGPTVLLRTDMDGLPVTEETGLPYASENPGVMHACGHDLHMTAFLTSANILRERKSEWSGTLVLVGQPAEEVVHGAEAMLRDGLYERFPRPDFAIAIHDWPPVAAGQVAMRAGYVMANGDSLDIVVRGVSGHGASPQSTKDPVVIASQIVTALQTIVSRETSPLDPAIITVGSIHGGTKRNIIPDEVRLALTVRTYKPEVRERVLDAISRIASGIAAAADAPSPVVTYIPEESTPATYNDPELIARLSRVVGNVVDTDPVMVSEDFSRFSLDGAIPSALMLVGAGSPHSLHSSRFAPSPVEKVLETAVNAEVSAVLELLRR